MDTYIADLKQTLVQNVDYNIKKKYEAFLDGVIVKWMFNANRKGELNGDLIPMANIVDGDDIAYFNRMNGANVQIIKFAPDPSKFVQKKQTYHSIKKENNFYIFDNKYKMTVQQKNRITNIYTGMDFIADCYQLLDVYNTLGGLSNNASFPPGLFGCDVVELFGSPLNTSNRYCSPFEFEKKKFSSLGSFFHYEFEDRGFYVANPPFDEKLMLDASKRILQQLKIHAATVVVVLPVWDSASQRKYGFKDYGLQFDAYKTLYDSDLYRVGAVLNAKEYKFYDYYKNSYIPYSNSHVLLMSSEKEGRDISIEQIKAKWKKLVI